MSKELGSRPDLCRFHGRRKNRTTQSLLKLRTVSLLFHPHSISQNKSHDQGPSQWDGKVHYTHREAMARGRRKENYASVRSGHGGGRVLVSVGFEAGGTIMRCTCSHSVGFINRRRTAAWGVWFQTPVPHKKPRGHQPREQQTPPSRLFYGCSFFHQSFQNLFLGYRDFEIRCSSQKQPLPIKLFSFSYKKTILKPWENQLVKYNEDHKYFFKWILDYADNVRSSQKWLFK